MYLDGRWYSLTARPGTYDDNDPIGVLDVTVLSNLVLDRILDIKDLRTSKRIDFVGGIRGLGELKRRGQRGDEGGVRPLPRLDAAPINIADTGNIMPPKTTWFRTQTAVGVVIHSFDEKYRRGPPAGGSFFTETCGIPNRLWADCRQLPVRCRTPGTRGEINTVPIRKPDDGRTVCMQGVRTGTCGFSAFCLSFMPKEMLQSESFLSDYLLYL